MVLDFLKLEESLRHMQKAYTGWTFALYNYKFFNVTEFLGKPSFAAMANIIDPFVY